MSKDELQQFLDERDKHAKKKGLSAFDRIMGIILFAGLGAVHHILPSGDHDLISQEFSAIKQTMAVAESEAKTTAAQVADHETRIRVLEHNPSR